MTKWQMRLWENEKMKTFENKKLKKFYKKMENEKI